MLLVVFRTLQLHFSYMYFSSYFQFCSSDTSSNSLDHIYHLMRIIILTLELNVETRTTFSYVRAALMWKTSKTIGQRITNNMWWLISAHECVSYCSASRLDVLSNSCNTINFAGPDGLVVSLVWQVSKPWARWFATIPVAGGNAISGQTSWYRGNTKR